MKINYFQSSKGCSHTLKLMQIVTDARSCDSDQLRQCVCVCIRRDTLWVGWDLHRASTRVIRTFERLNSLVTTSRSVCLCVFKEWLQSHHHTSWAVWSIDRNKWQLNRRVYEVRVLCMECQSWFTCQQEFESVFPSCVHARVCACVHQMLPLAAEVVVVVRVVVFFQHMCVFVWVFSPPHMSSADLCVCVCLQKGFVCSDVPVALLPSTRSKELLESLKHWL